MTSRTKSGFRRRLAVGILASTTALALAACGSSSPSTPAKSTAAASASPTQGGALTILDAGAVANWDPIVTQQGTLPGVSTDRMIAVYGVLMYVNEKGDVQGGIAKSFTSKDDKVWTLTLNKGVTFTDGTPLDATAVKFNWDRAAGEKSVTKAVASQIASSAVVDATTLTVTLAAANPVFDRQVAESLEFIASPKALQDQGANYIKPVGAGPFVLQTWDPAVGETFTRNKDYFEKGKPYLDSLKVSIVADPAQRVTTVAQGGANIMNGYSFQWVGQDAQPSVGVYKVPAGGIRHIIFNTKKAPFDDVRARQAVSDAINTDELVQTLTQDPSAKGESTLVASTSPYYDKKLVPATGDTKAAQKLVDQLAKDGVDLGNIKILAAAVPELIRSAELLQLTLNSLKGVKANVEQIPIPDWRARAYDQDNFDITFYPGVFDLNNAPVGLSNLFGPGGTDNFANFDNADMNAALKQAREATSDADKAAAFKKVQQVYKDQVPIVVFGIDYRSFFHTSDVAGFGTMGRGALLLQNLYLTK